MYGSIFSYRREKLGCSTNKERSSYNKKIHIKRKHSIQIDNEIFKSNNFSSLKTPLYSRIIENDIKYSNTFPYRIINKNQSHSIGDFEIKDQNKTFEDVNIIEEEQKIENLNIRYENTTSSKYNKTKLFPIQEYSIPLLEDSMLKR